MKDWNHILKISMHMKVLAICFLFCGLAGCSSRTNPYAFTYKKNFVGLNRDEALAELVSIRLVVEGQRNEEETDFQFKCYSSGDDPVYGMVSGNWVYLYDLQVSMPYKKVNELVKNELKNNFIANDAGIWLCFEYLRPSLHLSFSAKKEALGLWFDSSGMVTNQTVIVRDTGP